MAIPNTTTLIDQLTTTLFKHESEHADKLLNELIDANNRLKGIVSVGILLQGKKFVPTQYGKLTALQAVKIPSLHFTLMECGNDFLREVNQSEIDKAQIKQILFKILQPCSNIQDVRDALPECIVNNHAPLLAMQRTREEVYTIKDDVRAMKQWKDLLPKISLFAMSKFIY